MANKPIERDNRVRCSRCSLGTFSDGTRIGGLVSMIGPGKGQCCHCGRKYNIVVKAEREYNPDQYHEQAVDEAGF